MAELFRLVNDDNLPRLIEINSDSSMIISMNSLFIFILNRY